MSRVSGRCVEFTRCMRQVRIASLGWVTSQVPNFIFCFFLFFVFVLMTATVISASITMSVRNITNMEFFCSCPTRSRDVRFADSSILNEIIPILPKQTRSFQDPWNNFRSKSQGEREKNQMRNYLATIFLSWYENQTWPPHFACASGIYCGLSWVLVDATRWLGGA